MPCSSSDRGAEGLDVTVTMGSLPRASVTMPLQGYLAVRPAPPVPKLQRHAGAIRNQRGKSALPRCPHDSDHACGRELTAVLRNHGGRPGSVAMSMPTANPLPGQTLGGERAAHRIAALGSVIPAPDRLVLSTAETTPRGEGCQATSR